MDLKTYLPMARFQDMMNGFLASLPNILLAIIVLVIFYFIGLSLRSIVRRFTRKRTRIAGAGLAVGRVVQGLVIFAGVLIALTIALPKLKASDIVQLLGIGSVAVGFAFRDIFQNFLAGILILITHPFQIGDQIRVGDYEGTVEDIETRATFIKTYDARRIVIPNADLFTGKVIVNTAYPTRRIQYDIGIGYGDDIERARELILQTLGTIKEVLKDPPPQALVMDFAASAVMIRARWWIDPPRRSEENDSRDSVLAAIKKTLNENGIDLPYSTHQILFHDQTEETDGDRSHQREGWPVGKTTAPKSMNIARTLGELRVAKKEEALTGK
jgi:small conductance mechanosensitive channel